MSVIVVYPVEGKRYQVSVKRDRAEVVLEGIEGLAQGAGNVRGNIRRIGRMTFGDPNPISGEDFITRGGFLQMDRSLAMFAGILALLRHGTPVFLHEDGTLSTSLEPGGEGETLPA